MKDIVIGPIFWFVLMLVFGAIVAFFFVGSVIIASEVLLAPDDSAQRAVWDNPFAGTMSMVAWLGISFILCLPRWKEEMQGETGTAVKKWTLVIFSVPGPAKGAQLAWFGIVTPFILKTGKYPLLGERYGFEWFKIEPKIEDDVVRPRTISDRNGYIILGDITYQVWQSPAATTKAERTTITLQAGNSATVSGNLSFVLEGRKRINWVVADDTGLQLGNRARQELQEVLDAFIDTDIKSLLGDMGPLLRGHKMLTCFLPKNIEGHPKKSIIRDVNDRLIYVFVQNFESEAAANVALQMSIRTKGESASIEVLSKDTMGNFILAEVQVSAPITDLIEERGFTLKEVIYDNVRISPVGEAAANNASAQTKQREAQLASARANFDVRQALLPSDAEKKDPHYPLRVTLAAAQDPDNKGGVKVIHLGGGDNLTRSVLGAGIANEGEETP